MNATLQRRILRLETVHGRRVFTHLTDEELDARLRAELAEWLDADPDACPRDLKADLLAFVDAHDAEGALR